MWLPMKEILGYYKIIPVHIHKTQMNKCVKFEVSNTNISGIIDINVIK